MGDEPPIVLDGMEDGPRNVVLNGMEDGPLILLLNGMEDTPKNDWRLLRLATNCCVRWDGRWTTNFSIKWDGG